MLFRSREKASFAGRLRLALWPRRSFSRSLQYFAKRVLRLNATPHAVAAGVAAGVFASFFPLGLHFVVAVAVAWLIAGNLVAAAIATAFGNPLTAPFLWGASYETGLVILHRPEHVAAAKIASMLHHLSFAELWEPILEPTVIGALPLGFAVGAMFYALTRWGMGRSQRARQSRLAARRAVSGEVSAHS